MYFICPFLIQCKQYFRWTFDQLCRQVSLLWVREPEPGITMIFALLLFKLTQTSISSEDARTRKVMMMNLRFMSKLFSFFFLVTVILIRWWSLSEDTCQLLFFYCFTYSREREKKNFFFSHVLSKTNAIGPLSKNKNFYLLKIIWF